jgi:flagellar hook-associated protein 3 FlgL
MSGSIGYAGGAGASSEYGTYALLVAQSTQLNAKINTLTEQTSTGLVSTVFSGLGAGAQTALDLSFQVAEQTAQISGISSADQKLTITQSALGQIGSIAANLVSQTGAFNTLNPENVDNIAATARADLQQLAGLLNTQSGQDYLFGGSETGAPPVPDPSDILTSGFYTSINTAVQGLAANGASATIAATLATASSNAAGTSPFSAALSQPDSGFAAVMNDATNTLNSVVAAVADDQGVLGNTQSQIDAASTALSDNKTALTGQIANIEDVNIASVSTQLTQTQANLQASYKLIVNLSSDSLVSYLPS